MLCMENLLLPRLEAKCLSTVMGSWPHQGPIVAINLPGKIKTNMNASFQLARCEIV